jgi:V-type H+-transporting ATPase subunit E
MGDMDMSRNIRDFIVEEARDEALELSILGTKEFERQKRGLLRESTKRVDGQHE